MTCPLDTRSPNRLPMDLSCDSFLDTLLSHREHCEIRGENLNDKYALPSVAKESVTTEKHPHFHYLILSLVIDNTLPIVFQAFFRIRYF